MTPGARVQAAITILDEICDGMPAEKALTGWARASRFAGSKDRAAVRDYVYESLRHWRSDAIRGGGDTGRARMIGRLRAHGADLSEYFHGQGHAPAPLTQQELHAGGAPSSAGDMYDLPDWLIPVFQNCLGPEWTDSAKELQDRAPISVRVNQKKTSLEAAVDSLARDGIEVRCNPRAPLALTLTSGARRLKNSTAYLEGHVEPQDASSQAAAAQVKGTGTLLDYCAGGGGKSLAFAAMGWSVTAHDAQSGRMRDLPERAQRHGHAIEIMQNPSGQFQAVFCDVPCSGSGTWRRTPEAKWTFTEAKLAHVIQTQMQILDEACQFVCPNGALYYATCSVFVDENDTQIANFTQRNPNWLTEQTWSWPIGLDGDGFYLARLRRRD